MSNTHIITFRCTDSEYIRINAAAKAASVSKSEYIRLATITKSCVYLLTSGNKIASLLFQIKKQLDLLPTNIGDTLIKNYGINPLSRSDWMTFEHEISYVTHDIIQKEDTICQLLESLIAKITPTKK